MNPTRRHSTIHTDSWDKRFYLSSIQDFKSPLARPHSQGKRSTRLPLSLNSSVHARLKGPARSVNLPPRSKELTEEQMKLLKTELQEVWDSANLPDFHRTAFTERIEKMPLAQAVKAIVLEVKSIQQRDAPIVKVISAISTRESLLSQLQLFRLDEEDTARSRQRTVQQYEATLHKYRQVTIQVVEQIAEWRRRLQNRDLKFIWEGCNYLTKMKQDTAFIKHSDLTKVFPLEQNTFLNYVKPFNTARSKTSKVNLPLTEVMQSRLKKAEIQLKMEDSLQFSKTGEQMRREVFLDPDVSQIICKPSRLSSRASNERPKPLAPKLTPTVQPVRKMKLDNATILELAGLLVSELIEELVEVEIPKFSRESSLEVVVAALALYSSTILDRVIIEALDDLIPEVTLEAWNEEADIEYVGFQLEVIDRVIQHELISSVNVWVNQELAETIKEDWITHIYFTDFVQEALDEEHAWNSKIILDIFTAFVNSIMDEEWIELLAESELEEELLDSKRQDMNPALQRELYYREKPFYIAKIAESMWFDWLNQIIADTWLPRLVEDCVSGEEVEDDRLFAFEFPVLRTSSRNTYRW